MLLWFWQSLHHNFLGGGERPDRDSPTTGWWLGHWLEMWETQLPALPESAWSGIKTSALNQPNQSLEAGPSMFQASILTSRTHRRSLLNILTQFCFCKNPLKNLWFCSSVTWKQTMMPWKLPQNRIVVFQSALSPTRKPAPQHNPLKRTFPVWKRVQEKGRETRNGSNRTLSNWIWFRVSDLCEPTKWSNPEGLVPEKPHEPCAHFKICKTHMSQSLQVLQSSAWLKITWL